MGYDRDDRSYGENRWRDRDRGPMRRDQSGRDDDRGFFDRAGDEVRSWFGDEDAERRRDADERRMERERSMSGYRDNRSSGRDDYARRETGGGYGNQRGWEEDRPRESSNDYRDYARSGRGSYDAADTWGSSEGGYTGASGFGGDSDRGRRFDRIDAGSTGTHGAHPMSAPAGSVYGGGGGGYGISPSGRASSSSARYAGMSDRGRGQDHDPHYSQWRERQISSLDSDYDEYRREHQSKFEQEFGNWRDKRQGQRQSMRRVSEHMEVVGSDGQHLGTVDKVRGDRIILTKNDENAGGHHHSIPCGWIENVDDKVTINKSADDAKKAWRDEDSSRALYEREDSGSEGPHVLDRSFSGTYSDKR